MLTSDRGEGDEDGEEGVGVALLEEGVAPAFLLLLLEASRPGLTS